MDKNIPKEAYENCVMSAAPHTSVWDGVYALGAFAIMGIPLKFAIKKEFNYPILGHLLTSAGALWIDRSATAKDGKRKSYVDMMAEVFEGQTNLALMIAPEGTRKRISKWKSGFYHIAKTAKIPICIGYVDYGRKQAGVLGPIFPSDDMQADMRKIMDLYKDITPKYPEKFTIDERYLNVREN